MHCLGEGAVLAQPRDCPVPLGAGGVPGDVQQSERCDGSNRGVWGEMVPGELGGVSTVPPGTTWSCGAGWCLARGRGRAEGPSFLGAQHGVTPGGISAPPNAHGALTPSVCSPDKHKQPCAHTPAHPSNAQVRAGVLPPSQGWPPLTGWDFKPAGIRTFRLCPPHTGFTDSLETVTGAGEVRSIKQRAAARAGDSNNKSCCVQWLKLVFKKCPEKKLTPPKTRVGPIAANDQRD